MAAAQDSPGRANDEAIPLEFDNRRLRRARVLRAALARQKAQ